MFLLPPRDRFKAILSLGLPIIGGMISQNILNLVDTAMVGSLGDAALAAVGTGSFINFMCIAFVTGLSAGVQAIAARRRGEGRLSEMAFSLNGSLLIATFISIPLSILLFFSAEKIFRVVNHTPAVLDLGSDYLRVRVISMLAVGFNFSFRGYWNGTNRPGFYLRTLLLMHVSNIFLNWVLIFGHLGMPALGVVGAGLGTTIALYLGTIYYFVLGWRNARENGFLAGIPSRETMRTIIRLAIPNGLQQLFFAAGFTTLFWILGKVGVQTTSAANVLINVLLVCILPAMGLGIAAASLVGQAMGRGDLEDAQRWGWEVVRTTSFLLFFLGLPMWLAPDLILGIFLKDPSTVALARLPLQLVGLTIWFDGMGMVFQNTLLGAGDSRRVMLISVGLQWFLFLPLAYLIGPILGYGLLGIWIAQVFYRLLQAMAYSLLWRQGHWMRIHV